MRRLEEQLREYGKSYGQVCIPSEERLTVTVRKAKEAFDQTEQEKLISWPEFLIGQMAYIKKRWWLLQAGLLLLLWWLMYTTKSSVYEQKLMGVLACLFGVLLLPELWKNRRERSMEIEESSYYPLRSIYAARLLLFAMADVLFLSVFFVTASLTVQLTLQDLMLHFLLPFHVTCCICFGTLCSRRFGSEYPALGLCLVWAAIWVKIILEQEVYRAAAFPVWAGCLALSGVYLLFCVKKLIGSGEREWEVTSLWN